MPRISFFYDFTSPYTYLAATQIDSVVAKHGLTVAWEPALLGGIMKAVGNTPPALLPARGDYMLQDLSRWAALYRVPFVFSPHFPLNSMGALRGAIGVRDRAPQRLGKYNELMFRAAWVEGRDIAQKDVLQSIAEQAEIAPEIVLSANDSVDVKEQLKAQTQRAIALGAFGMPWIVVEEGDAREGYFGNDRLALLDERLARKAPWPNAGMRSLDTSRLKSP